MNVYHIVEFLIVGGAVAFSSWNLARRFVPQLRGSKASATAGGCSSCDACGSCGTPSSPHPPSSDEQPLRFHRS